MSTYYGASPLFYVYCTSCTARGPKFDSSSAAVAAWNMRAGKAWDATVRKHVAEVTL